MPPVKCDGAEEAEIGDVLGLVTRRMVDVSADGGFVSQLDITTNFLGMNKPEADRDSMNYHSKNRDAIDQDPAIVDKYPGMYFA